MIQLPSWNVYSGRTKNEAIQLLKKLISEANCWLLEFSEHSDKKAGFKIEGSLAQRKRLFEMIDKEGMQIRLNSEEGFMKKNEEDDVQWFFVLHFDVDNESKMLNLNRKA